MASVTFAQTRDSRVVNSALGPDGVSAARSQYIQTAEIPGDSNDGKVLAQFPRRGPGTPFPARRGYPGGRYRTPWVGHGNAGHILIGAAIGFGVGAALGANQSAHNRTPVAGGIIVGGGLLGFIGGCVGKAVGDLHGLHYSPAYRRRTYRPSGPEDDEQSDLRSHSKDARLERSVSAISSGIAASASQLAGAEASAPQASEGVGDPLTSQQSFWSREP